MKSDSFRSVVSLVIVLGLCYYAYHIFSPFFTTIVWSAVLAIVFYPVYNFFAKYVRQWIASIATVILVVAILAGPLAYIINSLVGEAASLYETLKEQGQSQIDEWQKKPLFSKVMAKLEKWHIDSRKVVDLLVNSLQSISQYLGKQVPIIAKNVFGFTINLVLIAITLFYFFRDGHAAIRYIKALLPFTEEEKHRLGKQAKGMVTGTVYGGLIVGVIQGIVGGAVFALMGISSSVFWGVAMAIAAFVPIVGTFLVWGPHSLVLFLNGSLWKALILAFCGVFLISAVDQFLKPIFIGGKTKLHFLLVMFSILGGINFFGVVGFIMGPLIIALALSVLKIHIGSNEPEDNLEDNDGETANPVAVLIENEDSRSSESAVSGLDEM